MAIKKCSKCESSFECTNEKTGCWCENLFLDIDTLNKLHDKYDDCLCLDCLRSYVNTNNIGKK